MNTFNKVQNFTLSGTLEPCVTKKRILITVVNSVPAVFMMLQ